MGDRALRQTAAAQLRGWHRRGNQLQRRRYLAAVAALPQARRQASGLRRDRRLRSEGGFALRVDLRAQAHRRRQDASRDRQGAAARPGARGTASDPGPRGHRQGRGDAMSEELTLARVQALVTRGPYHQWLGLEVIALHDDGIELKATWREEWVVNPDRRYTHGGILATLVDLGADWAMVRKNGRGVPTINLHVDYHAVAMPGDLTIRGKVVRMGGQFSTSEAHVFDAQGKLLASGRGTYLTAPPKGP